MSRHVWLARPSQSICAAAISSLPHTQHLSDYTEPPDVSTRSPPLANHERRCCSASLRRKSANARHARSRWQKNGGRGVHNTCMHVCSNSKRIVGGLTCQSGQATKGSRSTGRGDSIHKLDPLWLSGASEMSVLLPIAPLTCHGHGLHTYEVAGAPVPAVVSNDARQQNTGGRKKTGKTRLKVKIKTFYFI